MKVFGSGRIAKQLMHPLLGSTRVISEIASQRVPSFESHSRQKVDAVCLHASNQLHSKPPLNMDGIQLRDEAVRDRVRAATEFLDPTDARARSYRADIVLMLNKGLRRLIVSIDDIRAHNRELADGLLSSPFDHVQAFDQALKDVVKTLPNRSQKETSDETVR